MAGSVSVWRDLRKCGLPLSPPPLLPLPLPSSPSLPPLPLPQAKTTTEVTRTKDEATGATKLSVGTARGSALAVNDRNCRRQGVECDKPIAQVSERVKPGGLGPGGVDDGAIVCGLLLGLNCQQRQNGCLGRAEPRLQCLPAKLPACLLPLPPGR